MYLQIYGDVGKKFVVVGGTWPSVVVKTSPGSTWHWRDRE
jgi:hypothetical protein